MPQSSDDELQTASFRRSWGLYTGTRSPFALPLSSILFHFVTHSHRFTCALTTLHQQTTRPFVPRQYILNAQTTVSASFLVTALVTNSPVQALSVLMKSCVTGSLLGDSTLLKNIAAVLTDTDTLVVSPRSSPFAANPPSILDTLGAQMLPLKTFCGTTRTTILLLCQECLKPRRTYGKRSSFGSGRPSL